MDHSCVKALSMANQCWLASSRMVGLAEKDWASTRASPISNNGSMHMPHDMTEYLLENLN